MKKCKNGILEGKVSIVTGGARGIGKEIAKLFSIEGSNIAIIDNNLNSASETAKEIERLSNKEAIALKVDVSQKHEVNNSVKIILEKFKKIDILVNNAGIFESESLMECTEESWDRIIDVNLKGTFLCTQAVAGEMIKNKYGKIINISSCSAIQAYEGETGAYGASKAGVLALTRIHAVELGRHCIYVNAILPGFTATEMASQSLLNDETKSFWIEKTALKKIATPSDQANVALFLASSLSGHVTGEGIIVSGGEVMGQ